MINKINIRPVFLLLFLLAGLSLESVSQVRKQELSHWQLSSEGVEAVSAISPCYVAQIALQNGWIEDPLKDSSERLCSWLFRKEWVFTHVFIVDQDMLQQERVELVFEGLDTHVDVLLNGDSILQADNMFRSWRVDVKGKLKAGNNRLELHFHPALLHDSLAAAEYPFGLPDQRAFSRKAPYSYGWDWGPTLPDAGIWKPVYLESWSGPRIQRAWVSTSQLSGRDALCELRVELPEIIGANVELYEPDGQYFFQRQLTTDDFTPETKQARGHYLLKQEFNVKQARLWQPNGSGEPNLYRAILLLKDSAGSVLERRELTFGVRVVELDTSTDSRGKAFTFVVNGKPVFAKGANYVPLTSFPSEDYTAKLRHLLQSAALANFNMIRVWGGGYYEDDLFYQLCDSLGIMVWQDFMFACTVYPSNFFFLVNVAAEADEQVRRLAGHPSLVLWCGNNEVKNGWEDWGWQAQYKWNESQRRKIENGQSLIFNELLPTMVSFHCPGTPYWPSSPLWGWGHPEHLKEGDSHHWGVWWGEQSISTFSKDIPRFMSEYGMQAYPTLPVLPLMNSRNPMDIFSPATQSHQKHPRGHQLINQYMLREFGIVPDDPLEYIYLSQLLQAKTLETAIMAQRLAEPYCMGTLYWQLNDAWPSISWSSIDYSGSWKASHYFARRLYSDDWRSFNSSSLSLYFGSDSIAAPKPVKIKDLGLDSLGNQRFIVSARGQALCVGLMPNMPGYFDDNFFDLAAGESKIVTWFPLGKSTLSFNIKILTINDILYEKSK
jgi:beta-mannosidase